VTPAKRKELKEAWIKRGSPPCEHKKTEGAGGLEGKTCTVCGEWIRTRNKPGIDNDEEMPPDEDDP